LTMRVAVLGASGFIGSRTVEKLYLGSRVQVLPIVRHTARLAGAARFGLDGRVADGFDRPALAAAMAGCDVVIHAIAGDHRTIVTTAELTYRAAGDAGVKRMVYLSSASVHGQSPAPGTDEDTPLQRRHPIPYNRSKIEAEARLTRVRSSGSVELVMLRPGIVYGPRSYWTGGLADEVLAGEAYLVRGGEGICNALYIDNLVQAIELCLTASGIDGEVFLLGENETVTWREFYRPIVEALGFELARIPNIAYQTESHWRACGRRVLDYLPHRARRTIARSLRALTGAPPPASPWQRPQNPVLKASLEKALLHTCSVKLPWTKARERLGYEPTISFEEGCRRSVAWLEFAGYPIQRKD
jgi:nucleoside-diphosphate-sugar epimerase